MNKNTLIKAALVVGFVLTPAVIGRYGATLAEFLRADVLIGFGMAATLVALITLEYGRRVAAPGRAVAALPAKGQMNTEATVVAFPAAKRDERAAA